MTIGRIVRGAILTVMVGVALATFALSVAHPALMGWHTVHIRGVSMEPAVPLHALAYVEPVEHPAMGDIVTFSSGATPVTHRVIASWSGHDDGPWMTQGDANDAPDAAPIPSDRILGRVVGYVPMLGLVSTLLGHPAIIGFLVLIAAVLMYWRALFG